MDFVLQFLETNWWIPLVAIVAIIVLSLLRNKKKKNGA